MEQVVQQLYGIAEQCRLCPWECGVNRFQNQKGRCQAGAIPKIYTYRAHFGEEPPLVESGGSGTVFFSHCSLQCCYCQNRQFSQKGIGTEVTVLQLADIYLELQQRGCVNLNLVTAAHYLPWALHALILARSKGFILPVVYNSSGYERVAILQLLDKIVDVYLPDMRYASDDVAQELSEARNYRATNRAAIDEMFRQTGYFRFIDTRPRGTIIRILIIPGYLDEARSILKYIARTYGPALPISLMGQYQPHEDLKGVPFLERNLTTDEYLRMVEFAQSLGFSEGWYQEPITEAIRETYWGIRFAHDVLKIDTDTEPLKDE